MKSMKQNLSSVSTILVCDSDVTGRVISRYQVWRNVSIATNSNKLRFKNQSVIYIDLSWKNGLIFQRGKVIPNKICRHLIKGCGYV